MDTEIESASGITKKRKEELKIILENVIAQKTDSNKKYVAVFVDRKIHIFWTDIHKQYFWDFFPPKDKKGIRLICTFEHDNCDDISGRICEEILSYWEYEWKVVDKQRAIMYTPQINIHF